MCFSAEIFDCDSYFVFDPKDSRLEIFVVDDDDIVSTLNTESSSAASQIQWWWTALIFFCDFLWRSSLFESWFNSMYWATFWCFSPAWEIFVVYDEDIVSTLNTESSSAASQIQWWWTALIFFCDFLWRSSLFESWFNSMYWATFWCFSPAWDSFELTLRVGFICPFVVINTANFFFNIFPAENLLLMVIKIYFLVWYRVSK